MFNSWLAQNKDIINLNMEHLRETTSITQGKNLLNLASTLPNLFKSNNYEANLANNIASSISTATDTAINYYANNVDYEYQTKLQTAEIEKQAMLPNEAHFGSNNTTLLGYDLFDKNIFSTYTIKAQFARIIDDYFSMYRI